MNSPPSPPQPFLLWRLFALDPDQLNPLERTLLHAALFAGLLVTLRTFVDVRTTPGADLRNRVVGARVLLAGYDPYTFFWHEGLPEELLDPVHDESAHRLTLSPPGLLLYVPLAPLPYKQQRLLSFLLEWLAMIVSLCLLARSLPQMRQRVIFLCGALLFVIATDVWRLHLERGQIYVFYLLALSVAIASSQCGQVDSLPSGVALGLLALLRPNLLLLLPALFLTGRWRSGSAMLTTVAIGLAATWIMVPTSSWQSYLNVGDQYFHAIEDPDIKLFPRPVHTEPVEGVSFNNSLPNVESSSFALLYQRLYDGLHLAERYHLPPPDLALTSKIILIGLSVLLLATLWRRQGLDPRWSWAILIVLSLDTEFFLPHRWGYADVMLLAPLALLLPDLLSPAPTAQQALFVVVLGLLSGPLGQQFIDLYPATVLRSWLVMGRLTLFVLAWKESKGLASTPSFSDQ